MPSIKPATGNNDQKRFWRYREDAIVRINDDTSAVGLDYNESFLFQGAALVALAQGSGRCYGYNFVPVNDRTGAAEFEWLPVYSASATCLIPLENAVKKDVHYEHVKAHANDGGEDDLTLLFNRFCTVFYLKDFRWSQYHLVQRFILPWSKLYGSTAPESCGPLHNLGYVTPMTLEEAQAYGCSVFEAPREWNGLFAQIQSRSSLEKSTVFTVGPRNAGKSTMNRYLINRFLSSGAFAVYYLDTDLGQTEFNCEGVVSLCRVKHPLLGPPFTHLDMNPIAAKFVGSASPKFNPEGYLTAIDSLIVRFRQLEVEPKLKPVLLVNTPGWIKGFGYDLLVHILGHSNANELIVIDESNAPEGSPYYSTKLLPLASMLMANIEGKKPSLHRLVPASYCLSVTGSKLKFNSVHLRQLMTVSYFFHFDGPLNKPVFGGVAAINGQKYPRWRFQQPLLYQTPRTVSLDDVSIFFLGESVHAHHSLLAINGTLVVLASKFAEAEMGGCDFTGLGIVKSIDLKQRTLWIITPVSLRKLAENEVGVLVRASELDIPSFLRLDGVSAAMDRLETDFESSIPYIEFTQTSAQGDQVKKPRHNLVRSHLQA